MQWCCNRPDAIYQINIKTDSEDQDAKVARISSPSISARYARVIRSAQGAQLVYVSNRRGFEHNSCASLHKRTLPVDPSQIETDDTLVEIVKAPSQRGSFPGLYPNDPPSQCTLTSPNSKDSQGKSFLVLATAWASRTTIILVGLEDGSVYDAGSDDITSYKLLATDNKSRVVAIRSSPVSPPELVLGSLSTSPTPTISWKVVKQWSYRFQHGKHCMSPHFCVMARESD